jgi:transposase
VEHLAIDLGSKKSQVCVRASDGSVLDERKLATLALGSYLAGRPPSRVILETCAESFRIADIAKAAGHEVRVVPATLVRTLGVGARKLKTDKRDAQILSEVSCRIDLPSVHIPSATSRERKTICGMRETLVSARTQVINCVRGWLRTQGIQVKCGADGFSERVRHSHIEQRGAPVADYVENLLVTIEQLSGQIRDADKRLSKLAKADATCRRLMSVPGVGPVTSVRFVAALDDRARFPTAHSVESYVGLVPGEPQSADRQQRLAITKAGSTRLRWALVQAAWTARNTRPNDPMVRWSLEVEKRRGKRIAVVALARKLAVFCLRSGGTTPCTSREGAPSRAPIFRLRSSPTTFRPRRSRSSQSCSEPLFDTRQRDINA